MNSRAKTQERQPLETVMPLTSGVLQRACACGNRTIAGSKCASCAKEKEETLQRSATDDQEIEGVPPIVHEVLRSSGEPLNASTRALMESSFAHDFSKVRIHRDAKAAESANAVNALAYTVGRDIAFRENLYSPTTTEGQKLLAHELTHVVQQGNKGHSNVGALKIGSSDDASERAADAAAQTIGAGQRVGASSGSAATVLHRKMSPEDDPIHRPIIDSFRREQGLPEGGRDESGDQVGPTDAQIKYQLSTPKEDPGKIRIDAVADFLTTSLTSARNVNVHVNDTRVVALHWNLVNPEGRIVASTSTTAGQADATKKPFALEPAQFSGKGFVAGQYVLYCYGEDSTLRSVVYARRDFNVLSADLTTGTALDTTHGKLTFTQYDKTDLNPAAADPRYKVNVTLEFLPDSKVACDDVAFLQAAQNIDPDGQSRMRFVNADIQARETKLAWAIDQTQGNRSPYYMAETDPATGVTKDEAGYGKAGKGGPTPEATTLLDTPNSANPAASFKRFESCAMCRSGKNTGQVLGCATWGFTTSATGKVTLMPRSFRQMPSEMFKGAGDAWNVWRSKKPAAERPDEVPQSKSP